MIPKAPQRLPQDAFGPILNSLFVKIKAVELTCDCSLFRINFSLFAEGSDPALSMVFTDSNTLSTLFKNVGFSAHFGSLLGGQSGRFRASVALSDALVATEQAKWSCRAPRSPQARNTCFQGSWPQAGRRLLTARKSF